MTKDGKTWPEIDRRNSGIRDRRRRPRLTGSGGRRKSVNSPPVSTNNKQSSR